MPDRDIADKQANYGTDIAHLLPAELTAFYIGSKGIIPTLQGTGLADPLSAPLFYVHIGFALTLALLFYFVMPAMLGIKGVSQRLLYCITFLVWIVGLEVDRIARFLPENTVAVTVIPVVINLIVAVWSFGVPFIFRKINPGQT